MCFVYFSIGEQQPDSGQITVLLSHEQQFVRSRTAVLHRSDSSRTVKVRLPTLCSFSQRLFSKAFCRVEFRFFCDAWFANRLCER